MSKDSGKKPEFFIELRRDLRDFYSCFSVIGINTGITERTILKSGYTV